MIKIKILNETHFKPDSLKRHHDKHIKNRLSDEYPMDNMSEEDYDEIGNQLSLSKCDSAEDRYERVIGYKAADGDYLKHDSNSKIMVKYNYNKDETTTEFKVNRDEFMQRVKNGSSDNPKCYRVGDIPEDKVGTKTFDYDEIAKKLGIEQEDLETWRTDDIVALVLSIPEEKFNTLTRLYSDNPLGIPGNNTIKLRNYRDKELLAKDKKRIRSADNKMIGKVNVKFKVVSYGCNDRIEAIKVKFTDSSYPEIIKDRLDEGTINDIIVLSVSNNKVKKREAFDLEFKELPPTEQKQSYYSVGFYINNSDQDGIVFTNISKK